MIDISVLTGERLTYISRAADMLVLSFGDDICRNYRGEWLSRYALHCQCAWRITDGHGKIVLARVDIFSPPAASPRPSAPSILKTLPISRTPRSRTI